MGSLKISFTAESIRKLTCKEGNPRSIYYDKKQPKLACIVTKNGVKTFALHAFDSTRKKTIQYKIGRYPDIPINTARDIAQKLLAQLANGIDILAASRAIKEEPKFDDIFNMWLNQAKNRIRSWEDANRLYIFHIKPIFGNKKISSITPDQIRIWHSNLTKKEKQRKTEGEKCYISKSTANRCLSILKSVFNSQAENLKNPCNNVKMFKESPRDRFLQPDELKFFFNKLNDKNTNQDLKDFIYLLLFTGARRSNVMSMEWDEIDFTTSTWTIPSIKSKNSESLKVPIINDAMCILLRRKSETTSKYVFPGKGKTGHLVEPKRAWSQLVCRTGLKDLRLHDLRRTCGSYQAATGANQAVISKSLGHKNIATTSTYTTLNLDPVRESMERAAKAMLMNSEQKVEDQH